MDAIGATINEGSQSRKFTRLVHISFWLILFVLPISFAIQTEPLQQVLIRTSPPMLLQVGIAYLNINVLIPRFFKTRRFGLYVLCILGIIGIVPFLMISWLEFSLNSPSFLEQFRNRMGMDPNQLPSAIKFIPPVLATTVILFISSSYALARDFIKKERGQILLEKEKTAAELKFLRSQINPHFFFNALNNLYAVTRTTPEKTEQFIGQLSDMLRYVIYDCNQDKISLDMEIRSIESYLFFQKAKDPDHTQIRFVHEISNPQAVLEPMIIIPLLENAFKHGYAIDGSTLKVDIDLKHQDNCTSLCITNSLPQERTVLTKDPASSGVGLKNISQRLEFCYPGKHSIETIRSADTFKVTMRIDHD